MWRLIVWYVPMAIAITVGRVLQVWGLGYGLAFAWLGFCIYAGSLVLREQEFAVIERNGVYRTVYFRGWHIRVIGVDTIRKYGDMRASEYELYSDDRATEIDFTDGVSAPVVVKLWWRIGNPGHAAVGKEDWKELTEAVQRWTYRYQDARIRAFSLVDAELRPRLQAKTSDQASVDRNGIADETVAAIRDSFEEIGIYEPTGKKLLVIEDIAFSEEVIRARQEVLVGDKRAKEMEAESSGYWKAIKSISEHLNISTEEARKIYETQRGLDALREIKPSMNLVGKDVGSVLATLNLGSK